MHNNKKIRILLIISIILPVIYIILSLINIYNVNISTTIFNDTYEKWKDTTYFISPQSTQREDYIYSIMAVLPFVVCSIISFFSDKIKGFKRLAYSVLSFLIFIALNYIEMNSVYQSSCSDDWVQISLISKLQSILMLLNIAAIMLILIVSIIEIHNAKANDSL